MTLYRFLIQEFQKVYALKRREHVANLLSAFFEKMYTFQVTVQFSKTVKKLIYFYKKLLCTLNTSRLLLF